MKSRFIVLFVLVTLCACSKEGPAGPTGISELPDPTPEVPEVELTDGELLDLVQKGTFSYFWDFADVDSGAARERYHPSDPQHGAHIVATGGTGFGLMGILVGIERNFISRSAAVDRLQQILDFLGNADRFHGAWPHWLNGQTGKVVPFSALDNGGDLVETAFLAQGLVCIEEYFKEGTEVERALSAKAGELWQGVEWDWYTQGGDMLYWHWSPDNGFAINLPIKGYNETLIAYVMAAASPSNAIDGNVYENGWASNGAIISEQQKYGFPILVSHSGAPEYGGPLFWAHYSYLGLDPRNLIDSYADYWQVNKAHVNINYGYCVENPKGYKDYGPECWGLTASYTRNADGGIGYAAHSPSNDLGIISPTAALASMPYEPEKSMAALRFFYSRKELLLGPAGFYDAFSTQTDWVAEGYLAIDQGPVLIMIENHRSGLLWNTFMRNEMVLNGLERLGFAY
ncbi:MAG: glucoamylase family protein [Sediminicola sp.]